ncbi:Acetyltransferase (GNAT) domain-containing protein [Collimonas sp. OK242]|uniref:GNAT family N-acetyltransferase n=1 Tax=Collimonas sp. OK242 TaxID=1798195 RepID=UPI00089C346E|nr:GNAT family N-acetyltransferase [Collimonas sp. OK242]SDY87585.1 Acetyltransferase (GNAT) domain-containing protein [Collimonas sp. OK242]
MKKHIANSNVKYRRFTAEDAAAAHALSLAAGWPHRLADWQFVQRLGAGFVAESEEGVIGTAMCWGHGQQYASLGMVIVPPDCQGQLIRRQLLSQVLTEIGDRTILLSSSPQCLPLYEQLGFTPFGEVRQHQGTVIPSQITLPVPGDRIRPIGASDKIKIAALSSRAAGMPRGTVMAALLEAAEGGVVIESYEQVVGCAVLRRFGQGYAIGPVIAPDIARAKALISHWAGSHAGAFMRIDVALTGDMSPWLSEVGLMPVRDVVTMARGEPPLLDKNLHQYAMINQALG